MNENESNFCLFGNIKLAHGVQFVQKEVLIEQFQMTA